ncbi:MAG: hypothetical protein LBI28_04055 [Treponema sp.]|jgi:hypothetical protein|nr:hypothetical protein [Treponema sp.]
MNKLTRLITGLVIVLLFFSCATNNVDGRYYERTGGYSIRLPETWSVVEFPGLKYKVIVGPVENDFRLSINFVDENFAGQLDGYIDASLEAVSNIHGFTLVQRGEFVTLNNLKGERVEIGVFQNNRNIRLIFYFFPGKGDKKLVVTAGVPSEVADSYYETFDEIIKTFVWIK